MGQVATLSVAERIAALFAQLGISRAHLLGAGSEVGAFAEAHPDHIASATIVCPMNISPGPLQPIADRLQLIHGDRGPSASRVPSVLPDLPGTTDVILPDYFDAVWSNPSAERTDAVRDAILTFLGDADARELLPTPSSLAEEGTVAGISYHTQGSGPPLVVLPIGLAASQWDPLLPALAERYHVISLGGAFLGSVATLEERARSGFGQAVRGWLDDVAPRPGERILDVGCGSGIISRWIARRTGAAGIVAVDINRYLMREAASLAAVEGVASQILFQEGNATSLPFPDASFDVTVSCTVMEELNADQMLAELIRVTKPGGRIGVAVRGGDLRPWNSLPLPPEIRAKTEAAGNAGAADGGCADASLYRRFRDAGLSNLVMGPRLGICQPGPGLETIVGQFVASQRRTLTADEADTWQTIYDRALADGTMFWAYPLHCAIGTKP